MICRFDLRKAPRGFTLMELTVVLVIVGLLLGGLLVPLSAQRDVESVKAADKALADIREALIGFAVINGRLPCPAQASLASGAANAGMEAVTATGGPCACSGSTSPGVAQYGSATACSTTASSDTVGGVLPWATLGLTEIDPWGNRYTYHMNTHFGRANSGQTTFGSCTPLVNPAYAAFALCSPGTVAIYTAASGGQLLNSADTVPAVVLSHGRLATGVYMTSGTQVTPAANGTDEQENSNGDATFVSNTVIDDRLAWIPATQLMNRMIAAGRLP